MPNGFNQDLKAQLSMETSKNEQRGKRPKCKTVEDDEDWRVSTQLQLIVAQYYQNFQIF